MRIKQKKITEGVWKIEFHHGNPQGYKGYGHAQKCCPVSFLRMPTPDKTVRKKEERHNGKCHGKESQGMGRTFPGMPLRIADLKNPLPVFSKNRFSVAGWLDDAKGCLKNGGIPPRRKVIINNVVILLER